MAIFSYDKFNGHRGTPQVVGWCHEKEMFDCREFSTRILDMPIMFPGLILRIPDCAVKFDSFIHQCFLEAGYQVRKDHYAYLTVDQGWVPKDTSQRKSGCHVDGFQGARINPKVEEDFSFIISDTIPTVFYNQSWDVSRLNPEKDDFFLEFDRQALSSAEWRPQPYTLIKLTPYDIHRADVAKEDTFRTFLRLTFSVREFDRFGNNINPLFDYKWNYVTRKFRGEK